jgi:glutathione S-transferase
VSGLGRPTAPLRVHRIPFSTNVERIALACGIKAVAVEWVDHDPGDRSALIELSGQELTPVAEFGADVVFDSPRILERLDREFPDPPLYPADRPARARAEIFVEWFNEVWKRAPNALDADDLDAAEAAAHVAAIDASTARFEAILAESDYLLGPGPGIADVIAFPFLRYAVDEPDPGDADRFHAILRERLSPGGHPALDAWVERIRDLPQS